MQVHVPRGHMGHTVTFESPTEAAIFREDVEAEHFTQRQFSCSIAKLRYDTREFDWDGAIRQLLIAKGVVAEDKIKALDSLSNLHQILDDKWMTLDDSELNRASVACYEIDQNFEDLYHRFIKKVISKQFDQPLWWQRTPTIRFHFPRQKGFDWRVRYHTDIMLGHPPQEVNVWLAITQTYGSNSMCIAQLEPSYRILRDLDFDFARFAEKVQYDDELAETCARAAQALALDYGEFVAFDPRCIHATQNNLTDHTRISMDLRVLPESERERMRFVYRGTGRRRMLFAPGHYYDERPSYKI
jgi:hypothetical protein